MGGEEGEHDQRDDDRDRSGHIRTLTEFETNATGHVLAEFEVWFDGLNVIRARKQPYDWVVFKSLPDNAFPDCAYPLLIQRALVADFEYLCVDLEHKKQHDLHQVLRADDMVLEARNNKVLRRFLMDGEILAWIDWGERSRTCWNVPRLGRLGSGHSLIFG